MYYELYELIDMEELQEAIILDEFQNEMAEVNDANNIYNEALVAASFEC